MSTRSVRQFIDELGTDFENFSIKVKRTDELNAVILAADGAVIVRTCTSLPELATLICETSDAMPGLVKDRQERMEDARATLTSRLQARDENTESQWNYYESEDSLELDELDDLDW